METSKQSFGDTIQTIEIPKYEYDYLREMNTRVQVLVGMLTKGAGIHIADALDILGYYTDANEFREKEISYEENQNQEFDN